MFLGKFSIFVALQNFLLKRAFYVQEISSYGALRWLILNSKPHKDDGLNALFEETDGVRFRLRSFESGELLILVAFPVELQRLYIQGLGHLPPVLGWVVVL
jgi:hypothetical protein